MAAQRDEDRPGREHGRALITACGVLLAGASLVALVVADDARNLRLAVVGALWAFLLVSITGRFRATPEGTPGESDEELRRFYQMELQQEVSARKEYELRLEVQLRRELEEARNKELEELRSEVHRLRAELMGIEGPGRPALPAGTGHVSTDNQHPAEEPRRTSPQPRRPGERLQLPAGFSDSPPPAPPVEAPPAFAAPAAAAPPAAPFNPETSHPKLPSTPAPAEMEPFSPTEYIPAGLHAPRAEPSYGTASQPAPAHASAHTGAEMNGTPASNPYSTVSPEGSGSYPAAAAAAEQAPSPAWSSYPTPGHVDAGDRGSYDTGYDTPHSNGSANGASPHSYSTSEPLEGVPVERYTGGGRHGSQDASRPDPFDPSNTWPGAFSPTRTGSSPRPNREPEYPPQPAEWHQVEATPSRGRHSAGDDDSTPAAQNGHGPAHPTHSGAHNGHAANGHPAPANGSRPDDDVLAQILGRW